MSQLTTLAVTRARLRAQDTFTRTAATGAGIGSADQGGAWTLSGTGLISINGTQLVAALTAGTNRHATLATNQVNSDQVIEWQASAVVTSGTLTVAMLGRSIASTEQIRGKLTVDSAGAIKVQGFTISPTSGQAPGNAAGSGSETSIAAAVTVTRLGTFAANTKYLLRMQVRGQIVRLKTWLASQDEPSAWDFESTQTVLNVAGAVGWRILAPSGNADTITLDTFAAYTIGTLPLMRAYAAQVVAGVTTLATAIADTTTYPNGSTMLISGTFYEQIVSGTFAANRSIIVKSAPGQRAVISGSVSTPFTSGWTQLGGTGPVYTQAVAWTVYGVQVDGRPLLKFDTLAHLQSAVFTNGTTPAPPEGFFSNGTTLYVRLADSSSPDGKTVYYTRSGITDSGTSSYGITTPNNTTLILIDVDLENWPSRGISVGETNGTLTATRVWFRNVKTGVGDNGTPNATTNHIHLENCEYHMSGPVAAANQEYNGPYAIRKTLGKDAQGTASGGFNGIYSSNLSGRLINVTCDDVQITGCYIHDTFDCLEIKGRWTTQDLPVAERVSFVRGNTFFRFCDNGQETDSDTKYTYIDVDDNFYCDGFGIFSFSPFMRGAARVRRNIVFISEDWYADGASGDPTIGKVLKMVDNGSSSSSGTMAPIEFTHNTFILGRSSTQLWQIYETNSPQDAFSWPTSLYRDNITLVYRSQKWEQADFPLSRYNLIWPENASASFVAANFLHASAGGTANIFSGDSRDQRPTVAVLSVDPQLGSTDATRFIPEAGSPVLNAASDGTNLGAVQLAGWAMSAVGVGSAAALYRPSLPASIADAGTYWMGL